MTGEKGFLVLEVLIAGLILTASIAASMYLFKLGFENLQRANDSNVISTRLPQAVNLVKTLDMQSGGGSEALGDKVRLVWEPKLISMKRPLRADEGGIETPSNYELFLYRVKMRLEYKKISREYYCNVFRYRAVVQQHGFQ